MMVQTKPQATTQPPKTMNDVQEGQTFRTDGTWHEAITVQHGDGQVTITHRPASGGFAVTTTYRAHRVTTIRK